MCNCMRSPWVILHPNGMMDSVRSDISASAAVNTPPNYFDLSSTLWQAIYPTQWARGNWSFDYSSPDLESDLNSLDSSTESVIVLDKSLRAW